METNTTLNTNIIDERGNFETLSRLRKDTENKMILFIACFFGGFLGIHRFMSGKNITGVLWLLTFGLGGIGWVIDDIKHGIAWYRAHQEKRDFEEIMELQKLKL